MILGGALLVLLATVLPAPSPLGGDDPSGVERISRSVAVVEHSAGTGTGFLVAPDELLTAAHVAPQGDVRVRFADTRLAGTVVSADPDVDLSLVRLESPVAFDPLTIASRPARLGEEVLVIGAPLGQVSVTRGIVSSVSGRLVQTDASVNPGNSGGPLVRPDGVVVGLVTQKIADAEGIGFAVGIAALDEFLDGPRRVPTDPGAGSMPPDRTAPDRPGSEPVAPVAPGRAEGSSSLPVVIAALVAFLGTAVLVVVAVRSRRRKSPDDFEIRLGPVRGSDGEASTWQRSP